MKKVISIIISAIMLLSILSVGITANAEEDWVADAEKVDFNTAFNASLDEEQCEELEDDEFDWLYYRVFEFDVPASGKVTFNFDANNDLSESVSFCLYKKSDTSHYTNELNSKMEYDNDTQNYFFSDTIELEEGTYYLRVDSFYYDDTEVYMEGKLDYKRNPTISLTDKIYNTTEKPVIFIKDIKFSDTGFTDPNSPKKHIQISFDSHFCNANAYIYRNNELYYATTVHTPPDYEVNGDVYTSYMSSSILFLMEKGTYSVIMKGENSTGTAESKKYEFEVTDMTQLTLERYCEDISNYFPPVEESDDPVYKANPMKVKTSIKTIKAKKLKKKKQTVKPVKITGAKGAVTVTKVKSGTSSKIYKKIKVNKKTGAITFKKGKYAKKTYKIKLKIKAKGTDIYYDKTLTKTVKVKVK